MVKVPNSAGVEEIWVLAVVGRTFPDRTIQVLSELVC